MQHGSLSLMLPCALVNSDIVRYVLVIVIVYCANTTTFHMHG